MEHSGFFERAGPFRLGQIAAKIGAEIRQGEAGADRMIDDIRPLDLAGGRDLSFFDNRKYLASLKATDAAACLIKPGDAEHLPEGTVGVLTPQPYRDFARVLFTFYPKSRNSRIYGAPEPGRHGADGPPPVHPSAVLEDGVIVEPGAIVGPEARIGRASRIASGAVIGYRVVIGRDCAIGPGASIIHALVGDRVIVHGGARLGQDGFGFAMGPEGHFKVPQIGRVIVQDDVEIGANSTIDRGALGDTVIGEGTKIDNLVQIAHNVVIGRHCVIVALCGIAGSTVIGDFAAIGGQTGVAGHLQIGAGAQIAAGSGVITDIVPGAKIGGSPARAYRQWAREVAVVRRLAAK